MVIVLLTVLMTAAVILGLGIIFQNVTQKLLTPFLGVSRAQTVMHLIYRLLQLCVCAALFVASSQILGLMFTIVATIVVTTAVFFVKSD